MTKYLVVNVFINDDGYNMSEKIVNTEEEAKELMEDKIKDIEADTFDVVIERNTNMYATYYSYRENFNGFLEYREINIY